MVVGDQRLVHMSFVSLGSWSPCAPFVWNQGFPTPLGGSYVSTNLVKAPDIRFPSSHFRKQHPWCEKAVSRSFLAKTVYTWSCESISKGREDFLHCQPYQGTWGHSNIQKKFICCLIHSRKRIFLKVCGIPNSCD